MTKRRLMLIGAGALGTERARCFARMVDVDLVAIASRSEGSARTLGEELHVPLWGTDVDRIADQTNPEAVAICAINVQHYPLIKWALERDLHVFVEGPLCNTSARAGELSDLAVQRQRILEVGFQRRYHSVIRRAHDMIHSGECGQLTYGEVEFFYNILPAAGQPAPWYMDQAASGGMCVAHMSYGLNTLRYILGDPAEVFAAASNFVFTGAGQITEEAVTALLLYPGGAVAHIIGTFASPKGFPTGGLKAYGTQGGFALQILDPPYGTFWQGEQREEMPNPPGEDDLDAQCAAFVAALDGRGELLNPARDSCRELRIIEAMLQSARLRRPVAVP
jgi:predicted dehydrogenase